MFRRVLLIEDDQAIAEMYCINLSAAGLLVTVARDGEIGVELAAELHPDLICLDIGLPGLTGLEVMRDLASNPQTSQIPVMVVSNYSELEFMTESRRLGAVEY